jgi:protein TonB
MSATFPVGRMPGMPRVPRNTAIAGAVVLLHVAALWGMNSGLLRRAVEIVVPVQLLSEVITPPAPQVAPEPPPPAPAPPPVPRPVAKPQPRKPVPPPAPRPEAAPSPAPAPALAAAPPEPQPEPPLSAPVAPAPAPAPVAAPAPARVELPSTDADYLQNPQPEYPAISRRLGEEGQVMLRVLIGADGRPQQVELRRSSGYDRLDRVALDTVRRWRFVPGKRNGVAEAMWFNVPINFVLERTR